MLFLSSADFLHQHFQKNQDQTVFGYVLLDARSPNHLQRLLGDVICHWQVRVKTDIYWHSKYLAKGRLCCNMARSDYGMW